MRGVNPQPSVRRSSPTKDATADLASPVLRHTYTSQLVNHHGLSLPTVARLSRKTETRHRDHGAIYTAASGDVATGRTDVGS